MPMRDFEIDYLFKLSPIELYSLLGVGVEGGLNANTPQASARNMSFAATLPATR